MIRSHKGFFENSLYPPYLLQLIKYLTPCLCLAGVRMKEKGWLQREWGNRMQDFKGVSVTCSKAKCTPTSCVFSGHKPRLFILFSVSSFFFISCPLWLLLIIPSLHSARASGFILGGAVIVIFTGQSLWPRCRHSWNWNYEENLQKAECRA